MVPVTQANSFGEIRLEGQGSTLTINQVVQISVSEIKTRKLNPQSPYLGLRRFDSAYQHVFFGRDQLVAQLVQLLPLRSLVLLAGASGSGKSSVVRAGLIPQLAARLPGGRFRALTFVPDRDPFDALRACLLGAGFSQREAEVARPVSADTLLRVCEELRPPDEQWLIFIDQLEEIFTLCGDVALRTAFLDGLVRLAESAPPAVRIVLTMRADFFDHFGPYPQLGQLIPPGLILIGDLHADELRQVIEQPAAHHGVVFESGLVEEIIQDIQGRAGTLPLLAYTLDVLWTTDNPVDDRTLNTNSYRRLGGVRGALSERADALYDFQRSAKGVPRPAQDQEALRRIFLRLIDLTASEGHARAVSKRARQSEFSPPAEQRLISELVNEKLLVTNHNAGDATVEIAHEALLTGWPRLATWIAEGREAIYVRNRLSSDAHSWARALTAVTDPAAGTERAEDELWSGSRLQQALELRERGDFLTVLGGLTAQEDAFLGVSQMRVRGLTKKEAQRRKKLHRAIWISKQQQNSMISLGTMAMWYLVWAVLAMRLQYQLLIGVIEDLRAKAAVCQPAAKPTAKPVGS